MTEERRKIDRCPECNGVSFKWINDAGKIKKGCLICGKELTIREDEMSEFKKFAAEFL